MTRRSEVEDGLGWGVLVPSKAERTGYLTTDAIFASLKDENNALRKEFTRLTKELRAERERCGKGPASVVLDAFDEYDTCDAWAGLPIEFFNPGPAFA